MLDDPTTALNASSSSRLDECRIIKRQVFDAILGDNPHVHLNDNQLIFVDENLLTASWRQSSIAGLRTPLKSIGHRRFSSSVHS